ncbi:MAG TPA: glycosyltransferase [Candidatus Acidoferrales bacterium]|nr:glycosyltransferase [Candidatus Acidoferrales bacterium]
MSGANRYGELQMRLNEERTRLEGVRADYDSIAESRFHALRMLWFSFKAVLGISSPDDVYAIWSRGVTPKLAGRRAFAPVSDPGVPDTEQALVDAWNARIAARPMSAEPIATIVIPVFNHRDVTARCLRSIAESWFESLDVQFVVVDDGSTDGTANLVTRMNGIDYIRNGKNAGFVASCNRGSALSRGKYICFLNNDTVVRDGWLDHLVTTAEGDETIGIVGAKLVYPDGLLQEAGGIIWRDATGWNVGRNESPDDPRYNFLRDADYVSGAALLVRKDLFERVGGFSTLFAPAYYEDADLCFTVRSLGYRVVYQPKAVVMHDEGRSAGDSETGTKRFQEINRPKFREKWAAELDRHLENGRDNVPAASRRGKQGRTILVVDSYVPLYDKESGSQRMFYVVKMLRQAGYNVIYLPDNYAPLEPYTTELQQLGVEVLHHVEGGRAMQEALDMVLPLLDYAWISRPDLYEKYQPIVRRNRALRVIYDTVDLAHVRKRRKAELLGENDTEWRDMQRTELAASRSADATVVVTVEEKDALEALGAREVCVIPNVHEVAIAGGRNFEETSGLLFIGNYNHPPNVDAVQWLCDSVMPIVWASAPSITVTLVGSNPPQSVFALRSERVRVTGYVRDVSSYFRDSRILVAPLRFGAGMKGKIGQALQYALPVITTPVGAEGLGLRDGENAAIVAPDARAFAAAILALYHDAGRWQRLSDAAAETLTPFSPEAVSPVLISLLERLAALQPA